MGKLVCTGAKLRCSLGTEPAVFIASGPNVSATGAAGVITDTRVLSSLRFGNCTSQSNPQVQQAHAPQPCLPVVTAPWTPGSAHVTIADTAALDAASQCSCTWQGKITVSWPGQERAAAG